MVDVLVQISLLIYIVSVVLNLANVVGYMYYSPTVRRLMFSNKIGGVPIWCVSLPLISFGVFTPVVNTYVLYEDFKKGILFNW